MAELPTGTLTFLFTDIEGSTELLASLGERYTAILERHNQLLRAVWARHGGTEVSTEGDAFFVVFASAASATGAAAAAQRELAAEAWPANAVVRVRMGLHTGEGVAGGDSYVGLDVHRAARVASAAHGGQVLLSDATRGLVEQSLPHDTSLRDLGSHRLKGLPAPERIHQLVFDDLPADFPPISSLEVRPNNLPASMTSFVGRERQVAEIREHLGATRLLTLTGPGGTGKTRLAIRAAEEVLTNFAHGCWFVELSALRDGQLLPATIAASLGVKVLPDQSALEALEAWLLDRQLLLVLDNFEQITDAASACTSLLARAPGVRLLVTSRTPLHVYGEQEYPVPPLAGAPELDQLSEQAPEELGQYEAIRLFIERAVAVRPDFRVTKANAPAVAQICARLDGLPLAIELAAARVKLFTPEEMLARLQQNLSLLASSARDLPERQRTLRGAIDWSHELLSDEEQLLFARLSVFRGGFDLVSAEAVCSAGEPAVDVLDGVASLVDKSLVTSVTSAAGTRFGMLVTVRDFAREKLSGLADSRAVFGRHATHFLGLAREAGEQLTGEDHAPWLDRLERDQDNLRAAFSRAIGLDLADDALAAAGAMWRFWHMHGQLAEGRAILERLLAGAAGTPAARASALTGVAGLAYWQHDFEAMGRHYGEARQLYESLGDPLRLAQALYNEAYIHIVARDWAPARVVLDRSAGIYRELGNELGLADTQFALGYIAHLEQDDLAGRQRVESAIAIYRRLGAAWQLADALTAVGYMRGRSGDVEGLLEAQREALAIFERMGSEMGMSMVFDAVASAAASAGQLDLAARLFGKSSEILKRLGGGPPLRVLEAEPYREKVLDELGEDLFGQRMGQGAQMTTAEAIGLVRQFAAG